MSSFKTSELLQEMKSMHANLLNETPFSIESQKQEILDIYPNLKEINKKRFTKFVLALRATKETPK